MGDATRARLLTLSDEALLGECRVDRLRGSGPGGQKRNKTSSAVRLRHGTSGVTAMASESRSQHENRRRALFRLRERAAFDLREPVDLEEYEAPPSLSRLVTETPKKNSRWLRSTAYLEAVAQLIDLYVALGCSLPDAARLLGVSQGVLQRLARIDPRLARKLGELKSRIRAPSAS